MFNMSLFGNVCLWTYLETFSDV